MKMMDRLIPYQVTYTNKATKQTRVELHFVVNTDSNFFGYPAKDCFVGSKDEYVSGVQIIIPSLYCTDVESENVGKKLIESTFMYF